jgi:hypothetical protein
VAEGRTGRLPGPAAQMYRPTASPRWTSTRCADTSRAAPTLIDRFISAGEADLRTEYAFVLPLMVFNEICGCPPDLGERLVAGMSGIIEGADAENANRILGQAVAELDRPG